HAESVQRSLGGLPGGLDVSVLIRSVNTRPVETWQDLFAGLRTVRPGLSISIWTPGMTPSALQTLEDIEIDAVYSSLPWWDFRAAWLMEEYERLRAVAPVVAPLADPRASQDFESADMLRRLAVASVVGDGVLVPGTMPEGAAQLAPLPLGFPPERRVNNGVPHPPRRLTGLRAELTALFRAQAGGGRLLLLNPSRVRPGALRRGLVERRLPNGYVLSECDKSDFFLEPGGWAFVPVQAAEYIVAHGLSSNQLRRSLSNALRAPRIAIERVTPAVDAGAFPAKRSLGETVTIRAKIFMDGHDQ